MKNVIGLESREARSARETLNAAAAQGFETVIIFGFRDGEITINSSACPDVLRVIGALDRAKSHLWEAPDNG